MSERESAAPVAPSGWDATADVVVVGGGGGGLPAALFARWLGDEVILLAQAPELGGTARRLRAAPARGLDEAVGGGGLAVEVARVEGGAPDRFVDRAQFGDGELLELGLEPGPQPSPRRTPRADRAA